MKPLVSILIPAYNAEPWIADTIKSAVDQTWPRKEIIVVDDGSADQTLQVARRFASKNVSVVTQENQGAAATRNKAFELSQGDYIQWLDADDLLSPAKIEKQVAAAEELRDKRRVLSCGWGYFMYRPARAKFIPSPIWCDLAPLEWLLRKWEHNLHMQTATWLVSRELTEAVGPWDTRLLSSDDGEYFCRILLASNGVRFVPGAKVFYRIVDSNRLSYVGSSTKKLEARFIDMKLQISYLLALEDSERVQAACLNHLQVWFIHFYQEQVALVDELQRLAASVGRQLQIPRWSWKYYWMQKAFGWTVTKRIRQYYNRWKSSLMRSWDKAFFYLDRHNLATRTEKCGMKSAP